MRLSFASDPHLHENVDAVVGVTSLGRLVVALDTNHDRYVDQYIQLSEDERLNGPWSQYVERASVLLTKGTVRFEAADQSIGIAAGVEGAEVPTLSRSAVEYATHMRIPGAFELLRLSGGKIKPVLLRDVDIANFDALPERLQVDSAVVTPDTGPTPCNCDEDACHSGGCGASQCAVEGCSVTCAQPPSNPMTYFACCNVTVLGPNSCKCVRYNSACFQ